MKRLFKKLIVLMMVISVLTGASTSYVQASALSTTTDPYLLGGKWDKSYVSIYISDTPTPGYDIPSYYYIGWRFDIIQAIERWSIYLNDTFDTDIHFIYADTPGSSDIYIRYGFSSSWADTVNYSADGGATYIKSIITVDDWDLFNYQFDTYTVTNILTHELGLSLGLAQIPVDIARANNIYSVMVGDISSPYFSTYPTSFDEANLLKLYP
jgi:hypothetical protein